MKNFLNDLLTFLILVSAIICFYFAAVVPFSSALFNLLLFFAAIFLIIQGAGFIDRANGFGKYAKSKKNKESNDDDDTSINDNAN